MKNLLIIRHAKSSWGHVSTPDIDRQLSDRGKKDAPAMAHRLIKAGISIDRFVSSPARRARHTAELFAREFGVKEKNIVIITDLYHAPPHIFQQVIAGLDTKRSILMPAANNLPAIAGASFLPLSFRGRSMSGVVGWPQLLFACRMIKSVFIN